MSLQSLFNHKTINDPLYGLIGLSKTEVELLDTKAMQRIRRIRQMGFSSYVFPSGEHSRFTHSLGVLCIMGKICYHLYNKYCEAEPGRFTIDDVKKLRIAALMHDVGHYPFSHLSEAVYSFVENTRTISVMDKPIETSLLLSNIANQRKIKSINHEHLGAFIIVNDPEISDILKRNGIDPNEIGEIITGEVGIRNMVYSQLMHSSLDADRLDYLLRDSRQAGVVFGNVDLEYIIKQLCIVKYKYKDTNGQEKSLDIIAVDYHGKHAIEHFIMSRYFHYVQTVMHRTALAFEAVAKALFYKAISEMQDCPFKSYEQLTTLVGSDVFYNFNDDYMWKLLSEYSNGSKDEFVRLLWETLCYRKKPIHVHTSNDIVPKLGAAKGTEPVHDSRFFLTKWAIEKKQNAVADIAKINPEYVGYVCTSVSLESIPSHLRAEDCEKMPEDESIRDAIKIINKDKSITFLGSDQKSLINKMVDYESEMIDIFILDYGDNGAKERVDNAIKLILS